MNRNIPERITVASVCLMAVLFFPSSASAGLPAPQVPPPPLFIPTPPPVFLIPGTYVYFPPDVDIDLFFYRGHWYRPYDGRWYISSHYNSPWRFVAPGRVPRVLVKLPPGYRRVPAGQRRISYGQLRKNWKTWEQDKHWDRPRNKGKRADKKMPEEESSGDGFKGGRVRSHGR